MYLLTVVKIGVSTPHDWQGFLQMGKLMLTDDLEMLLLLKYGWEFVPCERGEKVNLPEIEFMGNSLLLGYYVRVN